MLDFAASLGGTCLFEPAIACFWPQEKASDTLQWVGDCLGAPGGASKDGLRPLCHRQRNRPGALLGSWAKEGEQRMAWCSFRPLYPEDSVVLVQVGSNVSPIHPSPKTSSGSFSSRWALALTCARWWWRAISAPYLFRMPKGNRCSTLHMRWAGSGDEDLVSLLSHMKWCHMVVNDFWNQKQYP